MTLRTEASSSLTQESNGAIPSPPKPSHSNPSSDLPTTSADFRRPCRTAWIAGIAGLLSLLALADLRLIPLSLIAVVLGPLGVLMVRRHPDEYSGIRMAWAGTLLGPLTMVGSFVSDQVRLSLEVPEGYQAIGWYELEPDERNPHLIVSEKAKDLVGQKTYIRGYVYPSATKTNLKQFILVRDSGTCCFGGQPKATDMIIVNFSNELRINYSLWPRGVGGTFQVKPPGRQLAGVQLGAYYLDADVLN